MKKCLVDMDGVLTDFIGHCLTKFKIDPTKITFAKGHWDTVPHMCAYLGITQNTFWTSLDSEFWYTMPQTQNYKLILETVQEHFGNNWWIVSSPANEDSAHGKILWFKKYLPDLYKDGRFALCRNKACCAAPNHVLIDDGDHNIDAFAKAGGKTVMWPTPHNRRWEISHDNDMVIKRFKADFDVVTRILH